MCILSVCMISSFLSPGSSLSLTQIMRDHNKTTIVAYDDLVQEYWNNGLHNQDNRALNKNSRRSIFNLENLKCSCWREFTNNSKYIE